MTTKPFGHKAYGSIPHLPSSRLGIGDHHCQEGMARIATLKTRDKQDRIIVQEKLDGSNVAVAKLNGQVIALNRAGYLAETSNFIQHHYFAQWVAKNTAFFHEILNEGERLCGEWLLLVHGTRYDLLGRSPFVAFDLFTPKQERLIYPDFLSRFGQTELSLVPTVYVGPDPVSIEKALELIGEYGQYGALDPVEGAIWRVESGNEVDFLVKYLKPDKVDGTYLSMVTGGPDVWNLEPTSLAI
jgi:hypothetical protein